MNRIEAELKQMHDRELKFSELLGPEFRSGKAFNRMRIDQLTKLAFKYRFDTNSPEEKSSLLMVQAQVDALKGMRRKPLPKGLIGLVTALVRFPFKIVIGATRFGYNTVRGLRELRQMRRTEEQNIARLNDQVAKLGVGTFVPLLDVANTRGKEQLTIPISKNMNPSERMDLALQFKRVNGQLELSHYEARLKNLQTHKTVQRNFRVADGEPFNVTEAFHLLGGRAVNRQYVGADGQPASQWVRLDAKERDQQGNLRMQQYDEGYGFDLAKTLKEHPFLELKEEAQRAVIARKLQAGELVQVHLYQQGKKVPYTIAADPAQRTIRITDLEQTVVRGADLFQPKKTAITRTLPAPGMKAVKKPPMRQNRRSMN